MSFKDRTGEVWEFAGSTVYLVVGPPEGESRGWTEHPVLLLSHDGEGAYFTPAAQPGGLQWLPESVSSPYEISRSHVRIA